jgi:serine-type D-Ala-D-Ala endopeptidase (penicillin-binding protein 7)
MRALILSALLFASNAFAVNITAHSWLETDDWGNLIEGSNITEVRSIASITKLMTVMAVIDNNQNMQEKLGKYTREQHIQLALVKSDNNSAKVLCDNFPGGRFECIRYMNDKANYLGMLKTKFVEPTGLSPMNISTALDLLRLVFEASHYSEIIQASRTAVLTIKTGKQSESFNNTNPIVGKRHSFIVSKTGTTNAAGGCIVMMLDTDVGRRIVIVLGSKNGKVRIPEAEYIVSQS